MSEDFDTHFKRYEMGQAYKRITEQMGPSPQLVAFINYDKVTDESLGLESFNIMTQHEAILAEIDADRNMHIAIEGFLSKLMGEKIPLHSEFVMYQNFHNHTIHYIHTVLNKVPTKPDIKAWENFAKHVDEIQENYFDEVSKVGMLIKGVGAKDVEAAGWTKSGYDAAVAWTKTAAAQSSETVKTHQSKLAAAKEVAEKAGENKAKIESIIGKTFREMYGMDSTGAGSAGQAQELLKKIASKFTDDKK